MSCRAEHWDDDSLLDGQRVLMEHIRQRFDGDRFSFLEYFHNKLALESYSALVFAAEHEIEEATTLLENLWSVIQYNAAHAAVKLPSKWQDVCDTYLSVCSHGRASVKRKRCSPVSLTDDGDAPNRSDSSKVLNHDEANAKAPNDETISVPDRVSSTTATDDTTDTFPKKQKSGKRADGSLESLVKSKFDGDYSRFFSSLMGELQKPTFSYAQFCLNHNVPRAKETLRNIVGFLNGTPTKQFLAERWKSRINSFLSTTRAKVSTGAAILPVKPHGDITQEQKSGRRRGRMGELDRLVLDKFDGDFFEFLAFVEREMNDPKFTFVGFIRRHNVTGARATLTHIVAFLKGDNTPSNEILAQMWKDRIRIYKSRKYTRPIQGLGVR